MGKTEKIVIKISILQALLGYDAQDLSKALGYSRSYLYKILDGTRPVTKSVEDAINVFIVCFYGSTMLELLNETIELVANTQAGANLLEGYRNEAKQ